MSIRQFIKLALILDVILLILIVLFGIYTYFQSEPLVIEASDNGININYGVERVHILQPAECLTFSWNIENATSVYFDDKDVNNTDQRTVCAHENVPLDYELRVIDDNGEELSYTISISQAIPVFFLLLAGLPLLLLIIYYTVQKDVIPDEPETDAKKSWIHNLILPLVIASPVIFIAFYLFIRHDATFFDAMPFLSDGVIVWHQAASFSEAGLDSGFYSIEELPPRVSIFRFYAWGPFISMIYGSMGKLIGTTLSFIVISNQILILAAMVFYVGMIRPNIKQSALIIALFALFPPLWIYSITSMDALLQFSMGIVVAAVFWKLIDSDNNPSSTVRYGLGLFLVLSAFCIRPTWGLLLLPYAFFAFPKHWILALIVAIILFVLATLGP